VLDIHGVRRVRLVAPALAWAAVIFALSSIPGTDIPSSPVPSADKLVHLGLYGVLGLLWFRCFHRWPVSPVPASSPRPVRGSTWAWTVLAALAFGVSDELHQAFVPLRTPDILDVLADLGGGALGAALGAAIATRRSRDVVGPRTPPTVDEPPPR
jgi:VanZ family protein